jgi:sialate O-acetylesterase
MKFSTLLLLAAISLLPSGLGKIAYGKITVPSLIGDNMIFQAGKKARVWGWAEPGESITVGLFRPVKHGMAAR